MCDGCAIGRGDPPDEPPSGDPGRRASGPRWLSSSPDLVLPRSYWDDIWEGDVKFVIYADSGGSYRWRLVASNGQTVATSGESFSSKANARRAAENVREGAGAAEVVEE